MFNVVPLTDFCFCCLCFRCHIQKNYCQAQCQGAFSLCFIPYVLSLIYLELISYTSDKVLTSKIYEELIQLNNNNNNKNQFNLKISRGTEQTFFQNRHTNGQQVHEKMLNITDHQGNTNQNHNEILPHTY